MAITLPTIDLSDPDRENTAKKLIKAMETVGCVYFDNVPGYNKEKEEKLLKSAKWFFSLPIKEKMQLATKKWNENTKNVHRGYAPCDVSKNMYREWFETGEKLPEDDPDVVAGNPLYEPTPWPKEEGTDAYFRKTVTEHYQTMANAGVDILKILAIGMGMDENAFAYKFIHKPCSNLALANYPYLEADVTTVSLKAHADTGMLTLIGLFSYHGLEVQMEDETWLDVEPRPGSLIMLIGELLSRISARRFKGTNHRVKTVEKGRLSSLFFFEPSYYAEFQIPGESEPFNYGRYAVKRLREDYPSLYSEMADFNTPK